MPRGASHTAEAVCFFRALEQSRPPQRRIVDDPFASRLLPRHLARLVPVPATRRALALSGTQGLGGLQRFVAARHRLMDDKLLAFLASGGQQLVILGAGYDTRAYRMVDALRACAVWEVDFPATQARKRKLLEKARVCAGTDAWPTFVPIDFEARTIDDALDAAGVQRGRPTFFIWEGVTMYLFPAAVDAALRAMRAMAGPGSEVIFDAWCRPEGSISAWVRGRASGLLATLGEPLRFSLAPDDASDMLARTGWRLDAVYPPDGLEAAIGLRAGSLFPDTHVVHAVVD